MPKFEEDQFQFPDEADNKNDVNLELDAEEGQLEIEIEDDTPEEDRGREPMPKAIVEELEKDDLAKYDEQTKQKLKQMRKVWHDERRAKEAAFREQQEAVELARRVLEENKRIKQILTTGEKEYVEAVKAAALNKLELSKIAYKAAYDNGEPDAMVQAQIDMQNANMQLEQIRNFKLPSLQEDNFDVQSNQQQYQQSSAPTLDARAQQWRDTNPWFGADDEMTATALGIHAKLERSGVRVGSEEYYDALDKTMRKRYSEYFEDESDDEPEAPKVKSVSTPTKPSTVVAPATRSTSSNKIKLKQSQISLTKKLGITPEQYALEFKKLERQNG